MYQVIVTLRPQRGQDDDERNEYYTATNVTEGNWSLLIEQNGILKGIPFGRIKEYFVRIAPDDEESGQDAEAELDRLMGLVSEEGFEEPEADADEAA